MSSSASRVWIDERLADLARDLDLRAECARLVLVRGVLAVVVEPGLADRDAAGVPGEVLKPGVIARR